MDKNILTSTMEHLRATAPWLRWIDIDEGQLETEERPPVAYPCALLDLAYPECTTIAGGRGRNAVELVLTVAFFPAGQTNSAAPSVVRERALERFDRLEELHQALQWWKPTGCLTPLRRLRCVPDKRFVGLSVYQLTYATETMA